MTVVVLTSDENSVALAADSLWLSGDLKWYASKFTPIIIDNKTVGMITGAGSAKKGIKFQELIITTLEKKLKKKPTANPLAIINKAVDLWDRKNCPETMLVFKGVGYMIDTDGFVSSPERWAIGIGCDIALGAMWKMQGTAAELAKHGCQAACELTASCGGEVDVFEMPRFQPKDKKNK